MRIFLSYPSELKGTAEPIAFSLRSRGHKVFLDRDDLPAGQTYEDQIHDAIEQSDLFVCLISPQAVENGRFTLTELSWARKKWGTADEHVLPVMVQKTDMAAIPSYLKSVTILEPLGNIAAEVTAAVNELVKPPKPQDFAPKLAAVCAISGLASGLLVMVLPAVVPSQWFDLSLGSFKINNNIVPLYVPLFFSLALVFGLARWSNLRIANFLLLLAFVTIGWIAAINIGEKSPALIGAPIYVADDQLAAISEAERADLKSKIDSASGQLRMFAWLFAGFLAGITGTIATTFGLLKSLAGPKRTIPGPSFANLILIGGVAGFMLQPNLEYIEKWDIGFLPLFVVWQGIIGAALAYALSHSRT